MTNKVFAVLSATVLFAACSSTDTTGIDTSQEIVDSIVTARVDSARNSFSAKNDSIINTMATLKADSIQRQTTQDNELSVDTTKK